MSTLKRTTAVGDPVRMSPTIERISFGEGAIGVHPTGSGGKARVTWLPLPGPRASTHCHVVVWTDDELLTKRDVVRVHAGPASEELLAQL